MDLTALTIAASSLDKLQSIIKRPPDLRSEVENKILGRFCAINEFLGQLSPEQQLAACRVLKWKIFKPDEALIREGDPVDDTSEFFIILSGIVRVFVVTPSSTSGYGLEVATLSIGETVGEGALHLKNGSRRNATCVAANEVAVVFMSKAEMLRLVKSKANLLFSPVHCRRILAKAPEERSQADLKFLSDVMSRFSAFRMLPKVIVNELCKHLKLVTWAPFSAVRRQGDPLDPEFGVILKGSVSVRAHHKDISDHVANPVLKRRLLLLREEAKRIVAAKKAAAAGSAAGGPADNELCTLTPGDTIGENAIVAEWITSDHQSSATGHLTKLHGHEAVSLQNKDIELQAAMLHRSKYDEIMTAQQAFINPSSSAAISALQTFPGHRTDQHLAVLKVLVGNLNVLRPAPDFVKDKLCSLLKWKYCQTGTTVFTQDTSPTHFYIILDGIVGFHRHESHSEVESMNMKLAKRMMTGGGSVVTTTRSSIAPNNSRKSTVSNAVSETSIALQYDDPKNPLRTSVDSTYGPQFGRLFSGDAFGQEELISSAASTDAPKSVASASTAPPVGSNKLGLFMIGGSSKKLAIAGDPAFFDALAPREYSVVALTDCQILELSAPEYFEIFSKCPARLMPQGTGAIAALKSPPSTRTPLQLEWIKNFMSQQRFLSQLPADSITELAHTVTLRSYSKGEYVVVEGDVGKEFYVVISGRFKVYERATQMQTSQTAEDAQATVGHERSTLSEGDTFGDKVFGGDDSEQVRISTVVSAQHGSEVAVISEDDYNKHFKSNSGAICFVPKHAIEVFKKEARERTVDDEKSALTLVSRLHFFRQFPPSRVRALCSALKYSKMPAGRFVCKQGELGAHFYVILSGTAGIYVRTEVAKGKRMGALRRLSCVEGDDEVGTLVARIGPGDSFGENALQGDNIRRNASVGCITNMELLILSREQYHEIVSDIADSIEFRPQLMHEKLAAAETGASKNEMLFTAVKKLHCFKDLPKPVLWQLVTSSTYESFENGDTIYNVSDKTADVYVILSGGVKVMMDGVSVAFLTDRDVFGHVEVVLPHSRRLATTIASEATSAVKIPRQVYLTLWPEAEGHKADIQFLRHLPGMSRVSPKSIMYLHYNILTHTYQRGTTVLHEGDVCHSLFIVREGYCVASRQVNIPYTATDQFGNHVQLPIVKPSQLALGTQRKLSTHSIRLRSAAVTLSKVTTGMGIHTNHGSTGSNTTGGSNQRSQAPLDATISSEESIGVAKATAESKVLGQEIVPYSIAQLGPASCFGAGELSSETVTASSCNVKIIQFPKARLRDLYGPAMAEMSELAVAFRTQRIDEFNTQITGTAAAPHYPYTVLRAPPEKGMDPRLQVESIIPHASSNIPLRRVVPASSILSKVVSKHGPDNASLNKSSGVSSDEDSDDDLYPPTGARHVAGHLNRDVMLASGAILSESSVRQRKQSIPDLHLFDRGADYTICPPAYISAPRPSTAASQPLESPAVDSSHDFTENSPQQPPQEPALATERCEVEPSKGHGTSARDVRTPSPTRQHEEPFTPIRSLDDVVDGRQSSARPSTLSSLAACFSDYHDDAVLTSSEMDNHESFEEEEKKCESQRAEPAVTRRGSLHSGDGLVGRKARARRGSNAPDDKKDEMTSSKFLTTKVITPGQGGTPADKWMDGGNYIPQPEFTKRPRTPSLLPRRASTDKRPVTADPSLIVCPSPVPEFTSTGPIGVVIDVPPPAHSESPAPVAEHRRRSAFSSTPDRALRVVPAISPSPLLLSRDPNRAMLEAATSHRIFSSAAVKSKAEKMFETLLSDLKLEGEGDAAPLSSSRGGRSARHSLDGSLLTPLTNAPPLRPITSDGRHHFSGNLDESPIPLVAPAPTRYIRHSLSGNLASKPVQHHHKQTRPQQQPHLARSIHAVDRHSDDAPTMLFQRPYALSAVASTTVLPTVYQ